MNHDVSCYDDDVMTKCDVMLHTYLLTCLEECMRID